MGQLALVLEGLTALEQFIQAGTAAFGILQTLKASVVVMQAENRDPNQAEWDALNAQIKTGLAQLNT